jgi:hypothetical protein
MKMQLVFTFLHKSYLNEEFICILHPLQLVFPDLVKHSSLSSGNLVMDSVTISNNVNKCTEPPLQLVFPGSAILNVMLSALLYSSSIVQSEECHSAKCHSDDCRGTARASPRREGERNILC